ncbi:DNA-binding protein [Bacteroides coprosuis DSM 18011]|uniref:DNA-binding protein n=1 Tax=Bacteroides coprosuis DSM 18011 TaxID=679937 RepID=F3ZPV4_9BACE|nr:MULTISPECIES: HU family DNA-binding protein [Bacteroides]EGJ71691.1 DNA-binding protein [Bacteroides coprosuis DSM 18011]HJD92132.1 HU domain-containing protein [Bacteroides coprosuis]
MSIIYRVISLKSNPIEKDSPIKYYPRVMTLRQSANIKFITEKIKEMSSLSRGDIRSVLMNFIEKLKEQLLEGKAVNIEGLGVFNLSLRSQGEVEEKDVNVNSIKGMRICFQASKDLRVSKTSTRAGEKVQFIRLEEYLKKLGLKSEDLDPSPSEAGEDTPKTGDKDENII